MSTSELSRPYLFGEYLKTRPLYTSLTSTDSRPEGNLLEITDPETMEAQVETLRWAMHKAKPYTVLEIGTNKGLFGFLLSEISETRELYTLDISDQSAKAVELLNLNTNYLIVRFILGDSKVTLPELKPFNPVDAAWVDGCHDYEFCLSDLLQCARLKIPYILVDDSIEEGVRKACEEFEKQVPSYGRLSSPFAEKDSRKIVIYRHST